MPGGFCLGLQGQAAAIKLDRLFGLIILKQVGVVVEGVWPLGIQLKRAAIGSNCPLVFTSQLAAYHAH